MKPSALDDIRPDESVVSQTEKTNDTGFGINCYSWMFAVAAFVVSITAFAFPISGNKIVYILLHNSEDSATPILFTLPIVGFLSGCFRNKLWRTAIMGVIVLVVALMAFTVKNANDLMPAWGSVIFLCVAFSVIKLALSDNKKLSEYPDPVHNRAVAGSWVFTALAIMAILVFVLGDIAYFKPFRLDASGSVVISSASASIAHSDYELWYALLFTLLPAVAATISFSSKRWISIVLTALIFFPIEMFWHTASNSGGDINLKAAFWIYMAFVTLMLIVSIIITLYSDTDIPGSLIGFIICHKKQLLYILLPIVIIILIIIVSVNYNSAESLYKRGKAAYEDHDWETAADNLLSAAEISETAEGYYEGFDAAFKTDSRELRVKALKQALAIGKGNQDISECVGLALWSGEFSPEINADKEKAVEWMCGMSESKRNEMGDEMARAGHYDYAYRLYATYPYVDSPIYGLVKTKANTDADYNLAHKLLWNASNDSLYAVARGDMFLFNISSEIENSYVPDVDYANYLNCASYQYELGSTRKLDETDARLRQKYIAPLLNAENIQSKIQYYYPYGMRRACGVSIFTPDGLYGAKFLDKHVTIGRYDQSADSILSPALDLRFENHKGGIVAREIK